MGQEEIYLYADLKIIKRAIPWSKAPQEPQELSEKQTQKIEFQFYKGTLPNFISNEDEVNEVYLQKNCIELFNSSPCSLLTINPYDFAIANRQGHFWKNLTIKKMRNNFISNINQCWKLYKSIYMFFEFSTTGRFHVHAIVSFEDPRDRYILKRHLLGVYAKKGNNKAVDIYPLTQSFTTILHSKQKCIGINYLTKDYSYMKSRGFDYYYNSGKTYSNSHISKKLSPERINEILEDLYLT